MIHKEQQNYWGHSIASPQTVALDDALKPSIHDLVDSVGEILGMSEANKIKARDAIFHPHRFDSLRGYESELKAIFTPAMANGLDAAVRLRSRIIADEIAPYVANGALLDIGCGNGLVSHYLGDRFDKVVLLDIINYVLPEVGFPYFSYLEGAALPVDEPFDTVLLLTVLHHADNPLHLLKEAWKATRKRLIIIESVFGADDENLAGKYALAGKSARDQMNYAIFVDWFCNRVLNDDIPTPYNFTTPANWLEIFHRHGMPVPHVINLGQDIPGAPELHFLFVLEKAHQ